MFMTLLICQEIDCLHNAVADHLINGKTFRYCRNKEVHIRSDAASIPWCGSYEIEETSAAGGTPVQPSRPGPAPADG